MPADLSSKPWQPVVGRVWDSVCHLEHSESVKRGVAAICSLNFVELCNIMTSVSNSKAGDCLKNAEILHTLCESVQELLTSAPK